MPNFSLQFRYVRSRQSRPQPGPHPIRRNGLSRVETIALVAMGVVLFSLLIPALTRVRSVSRGNQCDQHLIRLGQTLLFTADQKQQLPGYVITGAPGKPIGWGFALLPYLDRDIDTTTGQLPGPEVFGKWYPHYQQHLSGTPSPEGSPIREVKNLYLPLFVCPEETRLAQKPRLPFLSYVANSGLPDGKATADFPADWPANGVFLERFTEQRPQFSSSLDFIEQHDGAAYTIALSENADAGLWTDAEEARNSFVWSTTSKDDPAAKNSKNAMPYVFPINGQRGAGDGSITYARPSSYHLSSSNGRPTKGVYVLYCDGHTRFIEEQLDPQLYVALLTPDGTQLKTPGSDQALETPFREER